MFVLHPSSRCDICLEAFSWETEMAPYAIPCGHVFCRTCLEAVVPPKCPLCRKHYDPTRLKKLHVDRPDGTDTDPKEGEFLQRIALSFDAPEEHFRELVQEVDAWLQGKPSESCLPIRKARKALDKYQDLRFLGIENKREISRMKSDLTEMKRIMDAEKDRSEKVEENLLQEKDALQIQVDAYKAELEQLRTEIQRRALKNPLPPPPQPVSFPRYPPFDSKSIPSASGPVTGWFNSNGQPLLPSNGVSYVHPRNLWPEDDRENQSNILNESNGAKRDRKGKNTDANAADLYRSVYISNTLPNLPARPMTAAPAQHRVNGSTSGPSSSSTSLPLDNSKAKAGIIPGASTNSNFAPPDPEAEKERGLFAFRSPKKSPRDLGVPKAPSDPMREAMDPYTLTATLLPEYMNGFMEGYSSAVQTAGMHNAVPSSNSRPHQEPEASASSSSGQPSSSSERRERKRRERDGERDKERERDRRRERHRERDRERAANGDREHDRQQEREQRRERRASNAHRRPTAENLPEAIALLSSGPTRTTPGEDSQSSDSRGSRRHRRRTSEADMAQRTQVQAQATLASILSDNPTRHRRTSTSRPSTTAPSAQPQPVIPPPQQPSAQPTRSVAVPPPAPMPIAQPTPRLAAQPPPLPLVEPISNAEPVVGSPASRHTVQSVDTWGTVEHTPASRHSVQSIADTWGTVSPNSLASLNLQAFPLYQPQRQQAAPYRSPERPTPQPVESSDEEEESDEDEATLVSTPHYQHPTRALPATAIGNTHPPPRAPEQATPRSHTAYPQSASAVLQSSHSQPPYSQPPYSQPHGTRHTQTISVTQHYQNPTTMYAQRPQSAAVPPSSNNHNARNRSHDARPHRGHTHSHSQSQPHSQFQPQPHSQPHSRSQSRASHVATDGHGDVRIRRLSTSAAVTYASSSLSSLSLHSLHAPPPLHSAPAARPASNQRDDEDEEEGEDSDDDSEEEEEERANGNALGLEHSAAAHGGNVFGLQHGFHTSTGHAGNALGLAISQPPAGGPVPISAPTPRVSNRAFLNSFSHENYTK